MSTLGTVFGASNKQSLAFVAVSPDSLARFLMDKILSIFLGRLFELHFSLGIPVPVGNNGSIFFVGFDESGSPLTSSNLLFLGTGRWMSNTLVATHMLALGAFLGGGESRITAVAVTTNAHANWFVHAEDGHIRSCLLPLRGFDLEAVSVA